ncbi:MAG: glycine cleavage system protein GcvH [Deltaproteobacteria bacterium]|nr:MAG: glycine cleavage system protein GcvH [Deltaproteobacteria bacterium]
MGEERLRFSEDHVWVLVDGDVARLGITDFAQEQLGQIDEVNLTDADTYVDAGDSFGEIESQKAVAELISPISGTIINVNENVIDDPSLINTDPFGKGWLVEIEISDPDELEELMTEEEYEEFIEEE